MKAVWTARTVRQQLDAHRRLALLAALAFCLAATVSWMGSLGVRTVRRWAAFVGQNVHVIAYLSDEADPEVAQGLSTVLRRMPAVAEVRVVEPAEALAQLRALSNALGADPKSLASLEPGYFPRSLEIRLVPSADLSRPAEALAARLRAVPGVAQVDAMTNGLTRLAQWVKLARRLGWGLLAAAGLFSLLLLLAVFVRSQRALRAWGHVLLHLGETNRGVRLPTALWMAASALVGGAVGALVVRLAWRPVLRMVERGLGIAPPAPMPVLGGSEMLAGLAGVALLGLVLGYLAPPGPKADHA